MAMMVTAIRARGNHGTSENDNCNGSKKQRAQFHVELPLRQPPSGMVCTLEEDYLVLSARAPDFSIRSTFQA